ncbi:MAG: ActS/PrrB/RegB family redox-sensitive histidine kinase [Devosia sp.]
MAIGDEIRPFLPGHWRPLRLATLVGLRWLAIAGQAIGVLFVAFGLGFPLHLAECLALIALSIVVNLALLVRLGGGNRPSALVSTIQLAYDLLQLGGLLALTGGLHNPFSLLLLAPVSVSATTLPRRSTLILAGLAIAIASVIAVFHLPLPWDPAQQIVFDRVYVVGIWVSLVCGTVFIAAYTNRVAHEARQLADALSATELALSRHEQLSALDGLAAAAAHELGTPLSTIALAAKEMRADIPPGPLADDVELIIAQSARCRAILAKLRSLRAGAGDPFAALPLSEVLAEVAKPLDGLGKSISIVRQKDEAQSEPVFPRNVGLLYGLGNLIENAAQFAIRTVRIEVFWDRSSVGVTITDDGPGFRDDLIARLGEPYLTTRARNSEAGDGPGGLGLGIFIAKTLLERTGAKLAFENESPEGHARVRVVWPRKPLQQGNFDLSAPNA